MVLCVWVVKEGIQVIGKCAGLFLLPFIIITLITVILLSNVINIDNILPILNYGIQPVFKGAYEVLLFPFSQILVFVIAYSGFTEKKSPYKIYVIGFIIGGIELLVISSVVVIVLGVNAASRLYYPTYELWLRINIGGALQRTHRLNIGKLVPHLLL